MKKQSISSNFLDSVDDITRAAIIRLNQKLIDLQVEINAKLTVLDQASNEEQCGQKRHLLALESEVERALKSIDDVVNMVISDNVTQSDFLKLHQDDIEQFREMIASNADKIAKISDKS